MYRTVVTCNAVTWEWHDIVWWTLDQIVNWQHIFFYFLALTRAREHVLTWGFCNLLGLYVENWGDPEQAHNDMMYGGSVSGWLDMYVCICVVHSADKILTGSVCSTDEVFIISPIYSGCIVPLLATCFLLFLSLFRLLGGPFPLFKLVVCQMGDCSHVRPSVTQMCINYPVHSWLPWGGKQQKQEQGINRSTSPVSCPA